jgi:hypothetical protein
MPARNAVAIASSVSRKGASVVQLGSDAHGHSGRRERRARERGQTDIGLAVLGCRQVVIARAFIAQRAIDHNEIRRSLHRGDLAGGRNAEQKTATRREKLLGDQNGKCGSDRATHDTVFVAVVTENVQLGVIAGPALVAAGAFSGAQIAYDVAVGRQRCGDRALIARTWENQSHVKGWDKEVVTLADQALKAVALDRPLRLIQTPQRPLEYLDCDPTGFADADYGRPSRVTAQQLR